MTTHVHAGGVLGGLSICGNERQGDLLVNDADKANCPDCIGRLKDYCLSHPGYRYEHEVKRACENIGMEWK